MLFQVLLVFINGFVHADNNKTTTHRDLGDIPYENLVIPVASPALSQSPSALDYGDISYEKGPARIEDYGNVPYEAGGAVVLKSQVDVDYGNVPYEKGPIVSTGENGTMNIPGILQNILGGRLVPHVEQTTTVEVTEAAAPGNPPLETVTETEIVQITDTIWPRAMWDDEGDYKSPGTVDDFMCKPTIRPDGNITCSTCRDSHGYRIYCLNGTTTKAPSDIHRVLNLLVKVCDVYWSRGDMLTLPNFMKSINVSYPNPIWPVCPTSTTTGTTTTPTDPPSELTGKLIAKCFVCGMLAPGIPYEDQTCADNYLSHAYKKHCKYLNRDGWFVNGTSEFHMWGRWTGGCSLRYVDISPIYHQRSCRNNDIPAVGASFASRRLARLEYSLRREKDGCIASPTASLVPLSRGISLYSRFHVCVCSANYCNRAKRHSAMLRWYIVVFTMIQSLCKGLGRINF